MKGKFKIFIAILSFLLLSQIFSFLSVAKDNNEHQLTINVSDYTTREIEIYEAKRTDSDKDILEKYEKDQLDLVTTVTITKTATVNLEYKKYFIIQKEAVNGHLAAAAIIDFNEDFKNPLNLKDIIEYPLINENIKVVAHKVDSEDVPLEGVGFKLYKEHQKEDISLVVTEKFNGSEIDVVGIDPFKHLITADNPTIYTDKDGNIKVSELQKARYFLKEVEELEGYEKLEELIEVKNTTIIPINKIVNELEKNNKITIRKLDKTDKTLLDGAVFKLFKQEDTLIEIAEGETKEGILTFENLKDGDYLIREVKTPEHYEHSYKLLKEDTKVKLEGNDKEITLDIENARDPEKPGKNIPPNVYTGVKSILAYILLLLSSIVLVRKIKRIRDKKR